MIIIIHNTVYKKSTLTSRALKGEYIISSRRYN